VAIETQLDIRCTSDVSPARIVDAAEDVDDRNFTALTRMKRKISHPSQALT
jgi:hypothetical protein